MELSSFATHFLETVYKGVFIIYVPGGAADLGAGAEKSRRDLGGAETNPVDIQGGGQKKNLFFLFDELGQEKKISWFPSAATLFLKE